MSGVLKFSRGGLRKGFHRVAAIAAAMTLLATAGCRQDMHNQPKYIPLRSTDFFPDHRSARSQVDGTIARSQGVTDPYFLTGMKDGGEGEGFPFPVTLEVVHRGQERFNIYCSPCHSRVGDGRGILVQRGYYQAGNFHSDRLREAPAGHFFNVITNGYGAMPSYRLEVRPADRWAIAAYIRALQLSQNAKETDVASAAQFRPLEEVAESQGLPKSLVSSTWGRPTVTLPIVPQVARPFRAADRQLTGGAAAGPEGAGGQSSATPQAQPGADNAAGGKQVAANTPPPALPTTGGNAAAGKKVYDSNCMVCHQPTRAGLPPMIPSLVDIVTRKGAAHVQQRVLKGVPTANPPMPSFAGKLSPADINNLIAFLKTKP